jgi:pimeloyl-ACP methyl ester carboxylesterase
MNTTTTRQIQFRTVDGVRIRYADSGGSHESAILLTSPWPESLYAFVPVWSLLSPHARLVAVDLPGFGASEARHDVLAPRAMGAFLAQFITDADLGRPYIVAPDVGTAASLFVAVDHPELVKGLVVGAGATAVPLQLGEPLASWVLDTDLNKYRRMDPKVIVSAAMDSHARGVPDEIRADYIASYAGDRFTESMHYVRAYPEELPQLAELLPQITTPVTVIASEHDHVVPLANAEFLGERLRHGRVIVVDAGHFAWEEDPAAYAAIILDSIAARPRQT